jgi:hypothetical protein
MFGKRSISFLSVAAVLCTLTNCATPPERIKAGPADGRRCTTTDRERLEDLYAMQSKTATSDALGVLIIGVPLGGEDHGPEIARLKGRCGDLPKKKK